MGFSYDYGLKIVKNYNEKGEEGVKNRKIKGQEHPRGKKSLLTTAQLQTLTEELKKRPADGGIWTGPKVARWIEKEIGIEKVWNQRGWDYLKSANTPGKNRDQNIEKGNKMNKRNSRNTYQKK